MSDVEIVVGIRGDASGGRTIKRSLDDIANSGDKATSATKRLENQQTRLQASTLRATNSLKSAQLQSEKLLIAQKRLEDQQKQLSNKFDQITGAINRVRNAYNYLIGLIAAKQIIQMADGYKMLEARVNSITGSVRETGRVMGELRKISDQTGSSMEASVSILQRLSFARNEIKATNDEMIVFTETVTKMGIMSGASADALKNGLTQLGQALSSDVMRAEEFNSVMENTPGIGKAIADQFGVTTGQLRLLVVEGKVLRDDVFAAILNQAKQVRKEFQEFPKTAEQGWNQMLGRFTQLANEVNRATDGTNKLGMLFRGIGDTAKHVYNGIATVFSFVVAGILEAVNLMAKGFNIAIEGINRVKAVTPFADKTPIQKLQTVDAGSLIGEAYNESIARTNRLFVSDTKDIEVNSRKISQNYQEIASGLSSSTKLTKAQKDAVKEQKRIQDQLTNAIKESRTEEEKLHDTIAEMERLKPFAKTAEQAEAIQKNIKNARKELENLRVEAELNGPTAKAFASLASEIDDGFKDAFKSAFTESDGGFKKLLEGWKNTFKNFLAELAYQALARPIIVSLVGAVGGLMGLSGGAVGSVLGNVTGAPGIAGGGTGGLSGLSSLTGLLNGGLYSNTLAGIGGGIGNVLSGQAWGAMGPSYGASIGSGAFGNLGYGALGGIAASLFGLGSSNSMVNMATGTLGSLAGGAIGTSIGSILGMAGGPLGAIAGGFLGTALGGLFGNGKPSDKVQGGSLDLSSLETTTNGMTGKKFSQANADFRDKVVQEAINLTKLFQSVGGKTTGDLGYAIGSRDGMRLDVNGQVTNYGTNAQAFVDGMMEAVLKGTTGLTGTFKTIVDKLGVGDTAKLAKAFEFGKIYDEFTKSKDPVDILGESLKALNDQLAELQKTAVELGFPTDELTIAYNKQKEVILGSIKAQMAGFASLEEMTKTFKSFLDGQALGDSSLSPTQKLQLAQDNFGSLLTKAQGGDFSVTQDLLKAASELLNIGRGVYASSVSFAGLESFVRSSVTEIARAAGVPGYAVGTNNAASGLAWVGEKGPELVRMRGGEQVYTNSQSMSMVADQGRSNGEIVSLLGDILEESRASRRENERSRKLMESMRNKLAVNS